jgi:hypothetical protein
MKDTFRIRDVVDEDAQIDNFGDWLIELGEHIKESHQSFESASVDYTPKYPLSPFSGYLSYTHACKIVIVIEKESG